MINKKAILIFLTITFGSTIALLLIARNLGFSLVGKPALSSQSVILIAMFLPAIATLFTQLLVVKKPLRELGFKLGNWQMYGKCYLLICALFLLNYAITWAFFLPPDFTLQTFMKEYVITGGLPLPDWKMIAVLSLTTFVAAPILNIIPSLGEEIGWRGFLLPNLEPLGKIPAMIITGLIWALWHTPMILLLGFYYGAQAWPGFLLHFILVLGLGIWMGYIWFETRNTMLAAFIHATFNANAYGIYAIFFITPSKLIVGTGGLINATLFLLLGVLTISIAQKKYRNRSVPLKM